MAPYLFSATHWYIPESVCCTLWMVSSPFTISARPWSKKTVFMKVGILYMIMLHKLCNQRWRGSVYWRYLGCQGQTITKPAIGGPRPPNGLALPLELLTTIHLSVINHSDPLREGCKIEGKKKYGRIRNLSLKLTQVHCQQCERLRLRLGQQGLCDSLMKKKYYSANIKKSIMKR